MNFFNNFKKKSLIIAHRGFKSINTENSLESFKNSINKSDLVEFDVQFTKDYIPILSHDDTLERVSNVKMLKQFETLKPWFIKDFSYKQLKELSFDNKKVTSLEEFLIFASSSGLFFNLEIKDINNFHDEIKCIKIILDLIKKYSCDKQVLISAFEHKYLKIISSLDDNIPLAALDEEIIRENLTKYLKSLNVQAYNIDESLVTSDLINSLKKENIEVLVFTVNEKEKIDKLFNLGVKGIFTDKPYEDSKTR